MYSLYFLRNLLSRDYFVMYHIPPILEVIISALLSYFMVSYYWLLMYLIHHLHNIYYALRHSYQRLHFLLRLRARWNQMWPMCLGEPSGAVLVKGVHRYIPLTRHILRLMCVLSSSWNPRWLLLSSGTKEQPYWISPITPSLLIFNR